MNKFISYTSTNKRTGEATFREALMKGLAPDGGLYMPSHMPSLTNGQLGSLASMGYPELASFILNVLIGNEIDYIKLKELCNDAYNFEIPLERVRDRIYIMRLDRGPTASFKDFAARIMGRLMEYYLKEEKGSVTILTATSGDTGSAIANAFHGLTNIRVVILYPVNEVTEFQRKQMTTLKDNVSIIAVNGKFDDCQLLVKKAFMDPDLSRIRLISANSINIGRLLPQSVYYFWAWSRLAENINEPAIFSVPSGNFGNLMGGLIARKMGLPVSKFIVATNENDEVPEYLRSGVYKVISPSRNSISSAMNVGHPSNMARVIDIYGGIMNEKGIILKEPDLDRMKREFFAVSITDVATVQTIAEFYHKYQLLLEPHGAVAWAGLQNYLSHSYHKKPESQLYISLETAHPAKFQTEISRALEILPEIPGSLTDIYNMSEEYISLENNYKTFRSHLLEHY